MDRFVNRPKPIHQVQEVLPDMVCLPQPGRTWKLHKCVRLTSVVAEHPEQEGKIFGAASNLLGAGVDSTHLTCKSGEPLPECPNGPSLFLQPFSERIMTVFESIPSKIRVHVPVALFGKAEDIIVPLFQRIRLCLTAGGIPVPAPGTFQLGDIRMQFLWGIARDNPSLHLQ